MRNVGLFDVTFFVIRLYNVTQVEDKSTLRYSINQSPLDVCALPSDRGPCRSHDHRYHFNRTRGQCVLFEYGGCLGNQNNFWSQEECQKRCGKNEGPQKPALEPQDHIIHRPQDQASKIPQRPALRPQDQVFHIRPQGPAFKPQDQASQRPHDQGYKTHRRPALRPNDQSFKRPQGPALRPQEPALRPQDQAFQRPHQPALRPQEPALRPQEPPLRPQEPALRPQDQASQRPQQPALRPQEPPLRPQDQATQRPQQPTLRPQEHTSQKPQEYTSQRPQEPADVCGLPLDRGTCQSYVRRYAFDGTIGQCVLFPYSGCGGNPNNFNSEEECQERCGNNEETCGENEEYDICFTSCPLTCANYPNPPEICTQDCVVGCRCKEGFVKTADERCVKPEQCPSRTTTVVSAGNVCDLEKIVLPCENALPRYYYSQQSGQCEEYPYGLCGGNDNNFSKKEICQSTCVVVTATSVLLRNIFCVQEKVAGPCNKVEPRFYFNKQSGQCEEFNYGGCGGNSNNFITKRFCESTCVDAASVVSYGHAACGQDKMEGPCKSAIPRYYYSKRSGQCEEFTYGGCGGNNNNFPSKKYCESICKA